VTNTVAIKLKFLFRLHKTYVISIAFLWVSTHRFMNKNYYETEVTV